MNAFHVNAPVKIESKRGKSCGARRGTRGVAWRCEDNWVNTFGPAGGGDISLDRGPLLSCIMHARTYVCDIHVRRRRHNRARAGFEGNELRNGDTTSDGSRSIVRDLKKRMTGRRDSCRGPSSKYVVYRSRPLSRHGDCSLANDR